jgi:hypothetical protein
MRLLTQAPLAIYAPYSPRIRYIIATALRCQKRFF